MNRRLLFTAPVVILLLSLPGIAQTLEFERGRHKEILRIIKDDVKKNYFDPTFKGIDLEASFKLAADKVEKAESVGQMSGIIAQFMMQFDDSHLFFLPPGKVNKSDYGFNVRMAGESCFVSSVDKKSGAEKVGLQVGDEILSVAGFKPTRDTLWKIKYLLFTLRPQPGLMLVVRKPDGKPAEYAVPAEIKPGKRVMDLTGSDYNTYIRESEDAYRREIKQYYHDRLEGVFIWKMPSFSLEPSKVDEIIGRAKKAPALIIDMRGNGGGRVDMVLRLIGNMLAQDVKVADEKGRKGVKEVVAKSRGKDAYTGKVIALIDNGSASASEVFSRVMQLEKRGQVFGDRSAGAVMESRYYGRRVGLDTVVFFGSSITIADLIMTDGKSLEKIGVTPDVTVIPTGKDFAQRRDVVLAKALASIGINVTPEQAGAIFPVEEEDVD